MVVYLDQVLLLNGLLDYLLLVACGSVTATPLRRKRILLAALVGGVYAAISLLPEFRFLGNLFWELVFAGILCIISFGTGRGLLRRGVVFLLLAAAFSGIVLLLTELFSAPAALVGNRVYYPVSLGVLALTAGGAFGLMKWGLGRLSHQGGDVAEVTVRLGGRETVFTALRDTGNTLKDPISGCPVLVADGDILRRLLPEVPITEEELQQPAILLERLSALRPSLHPRLIPYKTVGVSRGMLLAIRPEETKIGGKKEAMLMAFSPVPVSDGGGYEALLGGVI